jgi:RNA polymerase sigma factor (sigma-70 family)
MQEVPIIGRMQDEQNRRISESVARERIRLWSFIRNRVANPSDAEDILQDVFYKLFEAYQVTSIDDIASWMFRVARNRIIDFFRKRSPEPSLDKQDDESGMSLADLLPSPDRGPEAAHSHGVLIEELQDALDELPEEQRDVFIAHEIEGRTFKELASETGVSVNTLLSRKRYAVLHLRRRLQAIYDEFRKG